MWTPANLVSLLRVALAVLLWVRPHSAAYVTTLIATAALSDVLDGWLARRRHAARKARGRPEPPSVQRIGHWLDPACDKLFTASLLGVLWSTGARLELLALIGARELIQVPLLTVYAAWHRLRRGAPVDFRARLPGKVTTVLQFSALEAMVLGSKWAPELAVSAGAAGVFAALYYARRTLRGDGIDSASLFVERGGGVPANERQERIWMVEDQLRARGIDDPRVLSAMRTVPRHRFVREELRDSAYSDRPLPIGFGQTISQPLMVALMLQSLELDGTERVLEIGTGSGYQAALLGELAREVYTVEIVPELAERARRTLAELGYDAVHVVTGDGSLGYAPAAPYDAIVVAAASPELPEPLVEQLSKRGRLVAPVGDFFFQSLLLATRPKGKLEIEDLGRCAFVPLRGEHGWVGLSKH